MIEKSNRSAGMPQERGVIALEYLVVLSVAGLVIAGATFLLGPVLLDYHRGVEMILSLPVP